MQNNKKLLRKTYHFLGEDEFNALYDYYTNGKPKKPNPSHPVYAKRFLNGEFKILACHKVFAEMDYKTELKFKK